jgi:hypothetical protein
VRQSTQIKNRIHGRLTTENLLFPHTDLYGRAGRAAGLRQSSSRRRCAARSIGFLDSMIQ